jgi:hypothetical protein
VTSCLSTKFTDNNCLCIPDYRHILYRPWCFPYIQPLGDGAAGPFTPDHQVTSSAPQSYRAEFLSVDMDSRYAIDLHAPLIMNADNPNMKIIFVVRNPIERIIAHYMDLTRVYPKLVSATHYDDDELHV